MRPHAKRFSDPKVFMDYMLRSGSEPLGGTVPIGENDDVVQRFMNLGDPDDPSKSYVHITLSLPKAVGADRKLWLQIVKKTLEEFGLNPKRMPWIAVRHTDSDCDHIHVALCLHDFIGRKHSMPSSNKRFNKVHRNLCLMLDLPAPEYFDENALPHLAPVTPARRINTPLKKLLYTDLEHVFHHQQPETLSQLDFELLKRPGKFRAEKTLNKNGIPSFCFTNDDGEVRGGELGRAWWPKALTSRLQLSRTLRRLRDEIDLEHIAQILKKPTMEKILAKFTSKPDPTRAARRPQDHPELIEEDGSRRHGLTSTHGSVEPAGGSKGVIGRDVGKSALELSGKTSAISDSARGDDSSHSAYGKANRNIRRDNEGSIFNYEPEAGQSFVSIEHPPRLTLGTLLARVCAVAANRTSGWKLKARREHKSIALVFVDLSAVVVTPHDATISIEGDEATLFRNDYMELIRKDKPEDERYESDDGPQM